MRLCCTVSGLGPVVGCKDGILGPVLTNSQLYRVMISLCVLLRISLSCWNVAFVSDHFPDDSLVKFSECLPHAHPFLLSEFNEGIAFAGRKFFGCVRLFTD